MAFDQHIEADQVGDDSIGLFSSIIARPILWLLGADQDKSAEEKRMEKRQLERDILGASDASDRDVDGDGNSVDKERCEDETACSFTRATNRDCVNVEHDTMDKEGHPRNNRDSTKSSDKDTHTIEISPNQKYWPQVGAMGTSSAINSPHTKQGHDCSQPNNIVDDLVVAMDSNTIDPKSNAAPATSAMEYHCELSYSSHSATEFPSKELSMKLPLHKAHSSNSIKSKKTSWSDERGNRPLVEYSDDHRETVEYKHWTQLRRKKRSSSVDSGDEKRSNTRRSPGRVIKSALRSGSYSPPVTEMYVRGGETSSSHSISSSSSPNQAASEGQMRSFHSLSMIGSSSGSDDSLDETNEKLGMKDNVQCVPSTLQQGGGRGNGGLIIPRGGPSAAYHLTMGTRTSSEPQAQLAEKEDQAEGSDTSAPTNNNNLVNGRMQAKAPSPHHHMFLPHPPNGHVSPQYGFYVNITPPTTVHAASRKRGSPLRPFEESSPQQQSFKGFSPFLPSPIPEVELAKEMGAAPTLAPLSERLESSARKNRMKPTFPKNRVAMGMVLAGNQHHHAWPSIPMG
mmetsp:Transcript_20948/g.32812  ORF Transcript_20948/g.32812 Transcript_20948/m.32812 type:complete len:567 (+) Transcript_20948:111-1811(+)